MDRSGKLDSQIYIQLQFLKEKKEQRTKIFEEINTKFLKFDERYKSTEPR